MQLTWFVTGAASGFGEQLVYSILERGDRVIATARRAKDRLQALEAAGASILELDVTAPRAEIDRVMQQALAIDGGIDVLVNNAAYIQGGILEELSDDEMVKAMETNFLGPLNLSRALLPHFRVKKSGFLIYMSSIGAYMGAVGASAYSATKGALESTIECLREEVAPFGIHVCLVTPGHFKTEIFSQQHVKFASSSIDDYAEMIKACQQGFKMLDGNQLGDAKKAMNFLVDAVRSEGRAAGKSLPFRLPLGEDGIACMRDKCNKILETCNEWEDFSKDTKRDGM